MAETAEENQEEIDTVNEEQTDAVNQEQEKRNRSY